MTGSRGGSGGEERGGSSRRETRGPLREAHSRLRQTLALRMGGAGLLWGAVVAGAMLVAAWILAGTDGWSGGSPLPLALVLGAGATLLAGGFAAVVRFLPWLDEARLAREMEADAGLPPGGVQGPLELRGRRGPGTSGELVRAAEEKAWRRVRRRSPRPGGVEERVSGWLRRGAVTTGILFLVGLLLTTAAPDRAREAWTGVAAPVAALEAPELPPLSLDPGDAEVPRGSAVAVTVEAPGRQRVGLHWQPTGEDVRGRELEVRDGEARFELPSVTAPVVYWAEAPDGVRSIRHRIEPLDPLFVPELVVEALFPPHTGRAPEEHRGEIPALELFEGSVLRISGRASRPLARGELRREEDGEAVLLEIGENRFEARWEPQISGRFAWELEARDGSTPRPPPPPLEVAVRPDAPPVVEVLEPGRDTVFPLGLRRPLLVEATDDHGLIRIEVEAYRRNAEPGDTVRRQIPLEGHRSARVRPVVDGSAWNLRPGDEVRYRVRAWDNAPSPGVGSSPEYVLRVPESALRDREVVERLDDAANRIESLVRAAERGREAARDLERSLAGTGEEATPARDERVGRGGERSGELPFETQEEVRRELEERREMLREVEALRERMRETETASREGGREGEGGLPDLRELVSLLDELAGPDLRDTLDELDRALEERDLRSIRRELEELSEAQEEFRRELEELLDRFRRAATDQEFRAAALEAGELAEEERELARELRDSEEVEGAAGEQERLGERAEELAGRLDRLGERLAGMDEDEAASRVEGAEGEVANAREGMERSASDARSGEAEAAARTGEGAAQDLEMARDELREAREEMLERMGEARAEALTRLATEALYLARAQEEVRNRLRREGPAAFEEQRGREAALLQGARNLEGQLSEAVRMMPTGGRAMTEALGQAVESMEATARALTVRGRAPRTPLGPAETAVAALNRLALLALSEGSDEGSFADAAQGLMQELQELAEEQGLLAQESGALSSGEEGGEGSSDLLEELAGGQDAVAGELGELARRPGARDRALGDLEAMEAEARALVERLHEGRLDPETVERQERLYHRLLDAGRTLRMDEPSGEREGTTAGGVEPREVPPLPVEAVEIFRIPPPGPELLQGLTPAERSLVLEYFERLNREEVREDGVELPRDGGGAP